MLVYVHRDLGGFLVHIRVLAMDNLGRRYDIDWLRVIAIWLLILYHVTISFQPFARFIDYIQSEQQVESLWIAAQSITIWRLALLFFVSGMGVYFALARRNWKQLLLERTVRILLPLIFGFFTIVPLYKYMKQAYYGEPLAYEPFAGHLWFLANIFAYVLLLMPIFYYLKKRPDHVILRSLRKLLNYPESLFLFIIPVIIEAYVLDPGRFSQLAYTWHGFWLGLLVFFMGFCFIAMGESFWKAVDQLKFTCLVIAVVLCFVRLFVYEVDSPHFLTVIEAMNWIYAAFGFGYAYLNKPSRVLSYLSVAVYPVYILHSVFQQLGMMAVIPLNVPPGLKFVLAVIITFAGCYLTYELVIRRINVIRPLFGLKFLPKKEAVVSQDAVTVPIDAK